MRNEGIVALLILTRFTYRRGYSRLTRVREARFHAIIRNRVWCRSDPGALFVMP